MDPSLLRRAIRKAKSSACKYKVAAIGFDRHGNLLGVLTNQPHINTFGGSLHAEVRAIQNLNGVVSLVILRVDNKGRLRPIHPCASCRDYAKRHHVEIKMLWALNS